MELELFVHSYSHANIHSVSIKQTSLITFCPSYFYSCLCSHWLWRVNMHATCVTWKWGTCVSRAQQGFTTCTKHRRDGVVARVVFSSYLWRAWGRQCSKQKRYFAQIEILARVYTAVNIVPVRMLLSDCADWSEGRRPTFSRFAGWLPLLPHTKKK